MHTKNLEQIIGEHQFFLHLKPEYIRLIAGCGINQFIAKGSFLAKEGQKADQFFIVRQGKIAIQTHAPTRGAITLQTIGANEVVGWSWLFPPYIWSFDVYAQEDCHVVMLDGACLREKCEQNHDLGFQLMKKFAYIVTQRLDATRLQLLDVFTHSH